MTLAERDRVAEVIEMACSKRYEDHTAVRSRIARELAHDHFSKLEHFPRQLNFEDVELSSSWVAREDVLWDPVERLLATFDDAVTRFPDDGKATERWNAPSIALLQPCAPTGTRGDMDALSMATDSYISSGLASAAGELWLARQLAFAEVHAFGLVIGAPATKLGGADYYRWAKAVISTLVSAGISLSIGDRFGGGAALFAFVILFTAQTLRYRAKYTELVSMYRTFLEMKEVYKLLLRMNPCPAEVLSSAERAARHSAVWPSGFRALLELAVGRSRVKWI